MKSPLSFLHNFFARGSRSSRRRGQAAQLRYRPRFDCLEDRCLLTTFVVTDNGDTNAPNQLRTILNSGSLADGDTIIFNLAPKPGPDRTILLDLGILTISKRITIEAEGPYVEINGHGGYPIFVNNAAGTTIKGLFITNAVNMGLTGEGGAIYNRGTLLLQNCLLTNNRAGYGGGIYNAAGGTLTLLNTKVGDLPLYPNIAEYYGGGIYNLGNLILKDSSLSGNQAMDGFGGGIYNTSGGTLTLETTTLAYNVAYDSSTGASGGGIFNNGGIVTVDSSILTGNTARQGGAIYNSSSGQLTVQNSTLESNSANRGGAIANYGYMEVEKCTLSGNSAFTQGSVSGSGGVIIDLRGGNGRSQVIDCTLVNNYATDKGGAIYGKTRVENCTVTGNTAGKGGGIYVFNPYGSNQFLVKNTIIAGNSATGAGPDVVGPVGSFGYNLIGDGTGTSGFGAPGDQVGTATKPIHPMLGPLDFHGGLTKTLLPLSGSRAIGKGGQPLGGTDQRGVAYPPNGPWDIGAVQVSKGSVLLAFGADAGGGPAVVIRDALTGAVLATFNAFEPAFTGGVRVAVGDVNGDYALDVVSGAGPGGGPQVTVVDGNTWQPIRSFYAFAPSFTGGVFVSVGDVNGDGFADIICGADRGGGPQVTVWSGKDGTLLASFYAFDSKFTGGVRVAVGDFNGDGFADIICAAGPGGGPQVTVFDGRTFQPLVSFYALAPSFRGGVFATIGDLTGDGIGDFICGADAGGGPQVTTFNGKDLRPLSSFYAFPPNFTGGARVGYAPAYSNPGQTASIVVGAGPGGRPQVNVFDPLGIALRDDFYPFDPMFRGGVFTNS